MSATLRWTLGLITGGSAVGYLALAIFGHGFRRSFGASDRSGLGVALPLLVQAALIASVVWPGQRGLLHAVAGLVVLLAVASVWVGRESPFVATVGLVFCALWSAFYWQAARS